MNSESKPQRLIEIDLPIRQVSRSAREELRIREGRLAHMHIWWARRPLAACRAIVCAALWLDPADPNCPAKFRESAARVIRRWLALSSPSPEAFSLRQEAASKPARLEEPLFLRKALLQLIAEFASWERAHAPEYLAFAEELTCASSTDGARPIVFDSFAGGGAIPAEALRVGANSVAGDLNPLAVLLNRITLEYVPSHGPSLASLVDEYGTRLLESVRSRMGRYYPNDPGLGELIGYLWARTVLCEGPACGRAVPIIKSFTLSDRRNAEAALELKSTEAGFQCDVVRGSAAKKISGGTSRRSSVTCPHCRYTTPRQSVERQANDRGLGYQLLAVVYRRQDGSRYYRAPNAGDDTLLAQVDEELNGWRERCFDRVPAIPDEELPYLRSIFNVRVYGINRWQQMFHRRQLLSALVFTEEVRKIQEALATDVQDGALAAAAAECVALSVSNALQYQCAIATYLTESVKSAFIQGQSLPMKFDFIEANPFVAHTAGGYKYTLDGMVGTLEKLGSWNERRGEVLEASCMGQLFPDDSVDALITDPPYYDVVPYADCSDFFIVWLKRMTAGWSRAFAGHHLSPKDEEIVQLAERNERYAVKTKEWFEAAMRTALEARRREVKPSGIAVIVFAHKGTDAWEALLKAVIDAGWVVTASWPINTENETRMRANGSAVLGSSVHLVCRPRESQDGRLHVHVGEWRAVLNELPRRLHQWLPRLADEGIVGADALFASLGPALEIFSRYSSVERASGDAVSLSEYLEHVWAAVSREALSTLLKGAETTGLEPDARVTAIWLWTLRGHSEPTELSEQDDGAAGKARAAGLTLEFDMARKIAQGLGARLEDLTTVLKVDGDTARLLTVEERAAMLLRGGSSPAMAGAPVRQRGLFTEQDVATPEYLGELTAVGTTTLDRVHQAMLLFGHGRTEAMRRLLLEEGIGREAQFWNLAQALSALYPPGSDEKRWVDGVVARKKSLGF